jgi:hypothetical protein
VSLLVHVRETEPPPCPQQQPTLLISLPTVPLPFPMEANNSQLLPTTLLRVAAVVARQARAGWRMATSGNTACKNGAKASGGGDPEATEAVAQVAAVAIQVCCSSSVVRPPPCIIPSSLRPPPSAVQVSFVQRPLLLHACSCSPSLIQ